MAELPELQESKAIQRPSGDHRGEPVFCARNEVNWIAWLPSRRETQISSLPVRLDTNAIRSPSGENAGLWSARVELTTGGGLAKAPRRAAREAVAGKEIDIGIDPFLVISQSLRCREIFGTEASLNVDEIGRGAPPATEMRQRLPSAPLREEANTISRLSAVQVMPFICWRSNVSCVARSARSTNDEYSAASADTSRMNATHLPSGENSGTGPYATR